MRLAQSRHLYVVSSPTYSKLKDMICKRCGNGFEEGQEVLSKAKKAHSRYGVYHKKCAQEVNLI